MLNTTTLTSFSCRQNFEAFLDFVYPLRARGTRSKSKSGMAKGQVVASVYPEWSGLAFHDNVVDNGSAVVGTILDALSKTVLRATQSHCQQLPQY